VTAADIVIVALGVVAVGSGIMVVTTRRLVHAALWLVVSFGALAASYVVLAAEFVAWVQVLIYVGAIVVLLLFGIMLTRAPIGITSNLDNDQRGLAVVVALFLLGVLGAVLDDAYGSTKLASDNPVHTSGEVGTSIFQDFLIPFEVISILLLAALIGAVVIARRD
jgi:NADH-quinone oxidoreductase subunit J